MARATGAPAAVETGISALANGAPAVVTGQQPGLFGGPIFTYYKTATAIALAQELAATLGEPVVPIFWMATDDSDFQEIATARVAGPDLALRAFTLPEPAAPDLMVGHLPADAGRDAIAEARALLGPAGEAALGFASAWTRGRDWGEGFAAHLYALWGDLGLVVVDARAAALRPLARALFARYLGDPARYAAVVDRAGDVLLARGGERQLGPHATAFPLWREEPPFRRRLADPGGQTAAYVAAALSAAENGGGRLWAGVALRPLAVDQALPTVARVLGPAEVAYMAQLAPGYAELGLTPPPAVPRLAATLVPPAGSAIARALAPSDPAAGLRRLVSDPTAALAGVDRARLPGPVAAALEELDRADEAAFARVRAALGEYGAGLEQLVDSVAGKARFQRERLWEAAVKREKLRREAESPATRQLPHFLRPDQGLQERQLSVVGGLTLAGPEGLRETVLRAAAEHLAALPRGAAGHHVLEVGG